MPVIDQKRLSIDFGWEHSFPSGEKLTYQMKFYHSDIGGIVQIGNGVHEPFEIPVEMFTEVAEFLISQGVIKGSPLKASSGGGTSGLPALPGTKRLAPAIRSEPVESLRTASDETEQEVDPEDEEMVKTRLKAKARAASEGAKNKFRPNPKPDPNPPKKRPGSVKIGEEINE